MNLTNKEKQLIRLLQTGLPLSARPFRDLGRKCGMSESGVIGRVKELVSRGLIRRLGGVFDSKSLGYATTLIGFRVRSARLAMVAAAVAERSEVTHCYRRDDRYNLWFTLHSPSRRGLLALFRQLAALRGVEGAMELPAKEVFKVDVNLRV